MTDALQVQGDSVVLLQELTAEEATHSPFEAPDVTEEARDGSASEQPMQEADQEVPDPLPVD